MQKSYGGAKMLNRCREKLSAMKYLHMRLPYQ